jgi:hypothetical protein
MLFHWRRIVLGINLGKISRIFVYKGVFPMKFFVQTNIFAWRVVPLIKIQNGTQIQDDVKTFYRLNLCILIFFKIV